MSGVGRLNLHRGSCLFKSSSEINSSTIAIMQFHFFFKVFGASTVALVLNPVEFFSLSKEKYTTKESYQY